MSDLSKKTGEFNPFEPTPTQNETAGPKKRYDLKSPEMQLPSKIDGLLAQQHTIWRVAEVIKSENSYTDEEKKERVVEILSQAIEQIRETEGELLNSMEPFLANLMIFTQIDNAVLTPIFDRKKDFENINDVAWRLSGKLLDQNRLLNFGYNDPNVPEIDRRKPSKKSCQELYEWLIKNKDDAKTFLLRHGYDSSYFPSELAIEKFMSDFEQYQNSQLLLKNIRQAIEDYLTKV